MQLVARFWARGPRGWSASAIVAIFAALVVVGCERSSSPPSLSSPPESETTAPAAAPEPAPSNGVAAAEPLGAPLGSFRFTMYYVAVEGDARKDERPTLASGVPSGAPDTLSGQPDTLSGQPDTMTLYSAKGCTPLATVNRVFGKQLDIQGTGKLKDGRVVNTAGSCRCAHSPCYFEINEAWGMGPGGRLLPFRSVAIDTRLIPLGKVLYLPELDGKRMPGKAPWGGFVHDGCVIAADRGGGISGHELDFFVGKKAYSDELDHRYRTARVTIFDGKGWCERREDGKVVRTPRHGAI